MIIGIGGKAMCGKDTVAAHLVTNHGFVKYSMADPLKEMVMYLFDMTYEQMYDTKQKEIVDPRYDKTPRWFLQYFGTDVCRKIRPDIWLAMARKSISNRPKVVIPDIRFINEMKMIKDLGGWVWRVIRTDHSGTKEGASHASEMEMDGVSLSAYDAVLSASTGQLESLYSQADEALMKIRGNK